jgi:hypothetical protein
MKSLLTTIVIIGALLLLLWGVSRYITHKIDLREKQAAYALTPGRGETAEQKQELQQVNKSIQYAIAILAAGGFLIFIVISHLNKPKVNTLLKQSSNQL